jgi:FAD/FMN-containing dehydrogenase
MAFHLAQQLRFGTFESGFGKGVIMATIQVAAMTGRTATLDETAVEQFAAGSRGKLLRAGDDGYDEARTIWNAMIDKRPALIARCAGPADVIHAVNFARANNILVSVRGGGHNVSGNAVCDGGLMIDLSRMKSIRVDAEQRTARCEPGVTWGEFDSETQAFGLATTGGEISATGVAGLTLGGGVGWLMGTCGLTCDNLLSVDIVTADGRLLTVSASKNQDLFWGVRGGGGNFGVVTSFEFRLHPVGQVLAGMVTYPLQKAAEVIRFYDEFTRTSPDALDSLAGFVTSPEGERMVAVAICHNGGIEEGERVLRPLRQFGAPLADTIAPMSYTQVQSMFDSEFPPGIQNYWKSNFLKGLDDRAVSIMVDGISKAPSPRSVVVIEQLGGAVRRVGMNETAFSHRNARYNFLICGMWPDRTGDAENIAWVSDLWNAMQPYSSGAVYVNYLGQSVDEGAQRVKDAYGPEKYERLVALKKKYDPTNLFRLNQNIQPSAD